MCCNSITKCCGAKISTFSQCCPYLHFQSHLPLSLLGEVFFYCNIIIKNIKKWFSPIINDITPHEMSLGTQPSYSHLKVFGCLCFGHNFSPQRHKFDAQSKSNIFRGIHLGRRVIKFKTMILNLKPFTSLRMSYFTNIISLFGLLPWTFYNPTMTLPISNNCYNFLLPKKMHLESKKDSRVFTLNFFLPI